MTKLNRQTLVNNQLSCTVTLDYDDPVNPFKHKYHPDHDNLDARFEKVLAADKESFTVARDVSMLFLDDPPGGQPIPGWKYKLWGGLYKETLKSLHKDDLYVEGSFFLMHVSDVETLN